MGSQCSISLYCEPQEFEIAFQACLQELERLEAKYSRYRPTSLISLINQNAGLSPVAIDHETTQLIHYAFAAYSESDGLFDITSGVLRKVWDFKSGKLPHQSDISKMLALIGFTKIQYSAEQIYLPIKGMEIDFGGIVKEYAADCLAALITDNNINHGLVNLAGDIHVIGPHPDGSPWLVGISHPTNPAISIAEIPLTSGGLASSGDYQRCFELNGTKYCHILNPKTGWPIQGLAGVSVWAEQCVIAGTLATITMLKGEQQGPIWLQQIGVPFLTINQEFETQLQVP